jgi:hypothetical protein
MSMDRGRRLWGRSAERTRPANQSPRRGGDEAVECFSHPARCRAAEGGAPIDLTKAFGAQGERVIAQANFCTKQVDRSIDIPFESWKASADALGPEVH